MFETLRNSGIGVAGEVAWGTHLCQFYQTKEDLLDLLVPYFKAGLESNEFCMWVTSDPLTVMEAEEAMRRAVPGYDDMRDRGQMEIVPYTDWYMKDGYFDMHRVFAGWIDKLERALERGFEGLRATGNTAWLEDEDWSDCTEYEEELERIIGDYEMMAVCTYSLEKCSASEVIDVVKNHQFALVKREGEWALIESSERNRERELAGEALRKLSEQLTIVNRELDGYARAVSHDLRSPLAAATLANSLLRDSMREGLDELRIEVDESTSAIQRNLARCSDLIDGILTLAAAGQVPVNVTDVDIGEVIGEAATVQERARRGSHFEIQAGDDLGTVRGNEVQIYQLFANLISNALQHNDSENPVIVIRRLDGPRAAAGRHRFLVRDNGPGIPEECLADIFMPFFKWGKSSDTGIGLSIVKKVVDAYGGDIRVYNDDGACFEFEISDA